MRYVSNISISPHRKVSIMNSPPPPQRKNLRIYCSSLGRILIRAEMLVDGHIWTTTHIKFLERMKLLLKKLREYDLRIYALLYHILILFLFLIDHLFTFKGPCWRISLWSLL